MNTTLISFILAATLASASAQLYTPPSIYKVDGYQVTATRYDSVLTNTESIRQTPVLLETTYINHFKTHDDPSRVVFHRKYARVQPKWDYWKSTLSEHLVYGPHRPGQRWLEVVTNELVHWESPGTPGAVGKLTVKSGPAGRLNVLTVSHVTFAIDATDCKYGFRVRFIWYCHTKSGEIKLVEIWRKVSAGQRILYTPAVSEMSRRLEEPVVFARVGATDSFCCYDFTVNDP